VNNRVVENGQRFLPLSDFMKRFSKLRFYRGVCSSREIRKAAVLCGKKILRPTAFWELTLPFRPRTFTSPREQFQPELTRKSYGVLHDE
jgi:hypothetical protein